MKSNEWSEVGELIFRTTNTWYEKNGKAPVFNCAPKDLRFFCEVYEALDPDCCLVVEIDKQIAASCFYHPRPSHYSLGIMCVDPQFYGRGLARKLLDEIIKLAQKANKTLHLISSAINLDSYSLYNKAGFVPKDLYQDMIIPVPGDGKSFEPGEIEGVRAATFKDIPAMVSLEKEIHGQDHGKDLQFIINDESGTWNCHVLEKDGALQGFLCRVNHPSSKIIGLGVSRNSQTALSLIKSHLDYYKGESPLVIVPVKETVLVQELLKMKARNVELHISQSIPFSASPKNGFIMPTFMPE